MMEYKGYLYTRRLMNYVIKADLIRNAMKSESGQFESRHKSDTPSLNFRLSFLDGTRYPFFIYKDRTETSTTSLTSGSTVTNMSKSDRYGTYGSYALKSKLTSFRYDLKREVSKSNTDFGGIGGGGSALNTTRDSLNLGMDKIFKTDKNKNAGMLAVRYMYDQTKEKVNNQFNATHSLDAALNGFKPSKNTTFSITSSYAHDNPSKLTTLTSNMNSMYTPSANFNANTSLYLTQLEDPRSSSNYSSLFTGSTYRINEYFTTNQNLMLYRSLNSSGTQTTELLSLGAAFSKTSLYGINLFANTSASGSASQTSHTKHTDTASYSGSAGVSKNIAFKRAQVNMRGAYNITGSSHPSAMSKGYTLGTGVTTRLTSKLNLQNNLDITETENISSNSSTISKTTNFTNNITYSTQLGLKGVFGVTAGANFTSGSGGDSRTLNSSMNLSYMLLRGLALKSSLGYTEDSISDSSAIITSVGLDYTRKKLTLSFSNSLNKNITPSSKNLSVSTSLRASRYF